jgi:hypothetical protein
MSVRSSHLLWYVRHRHIYDDIHILCLTKGKFHLWHIALGTGFSYGDEICSPGFEGPLCAKCIDRQEYFFSPVSWTCQKCSLSWLFLASVLLIPIFILLPVYSYWRLTRRRAINANPSLSTDQRRCSFLTNCCWRLFRVVVVTMKCVRYLLCCCRVKPPTDANPKEDEISFKNINYLSEINDERKAFEFFATIKLIISSLQVNLALL